MWAKELAADLGLFRRLLHRQFHRQFHRQCQ
jgi:AraC-like DNA-binding protein